MSSFTESLDDRGVVRFITCGSVDDGKSTLIGRLLYDSKAVLNDQITSLSQAKHSRVKAQDAQIDLSLLTDGLEAEREQGITIDVAYRYFSTPKRKFIVADAPGHEQYTRNMVTGASQVDAAVLLVDVTRLDLSQDQVILLNQTKRHAAIVKLLGIQHIGVALNKMDLIGFNELSFHKIKQALQNLAQTLGLCIAEVFPVSALKGDHIVNASSQIPWHQGPTLLEWLESLDLKTPLSSAALRLPVQWVARQDGQSSDDFRAYLGRIESGCLTKGQSLTILPTGLKATVKALYVGNQQADTPALQAQAGDVVAIELDQDVDISRGDMLVDEQTALLTQHITADVCWLDKEPLSLSRKYILRHTTHTVFAKIKSIEHVLDIETLSHADTAKEVKMNAIARLHLHLQKPIAADLFDQIKATGSFALIDESTHHTVAAGMIRALQS